MATTIYPHVEIDEHGVAIVEGTKTKVIEIVLDHIAHRLDSYEIRRQYPYLSLAQIHSALAFYYDNQEELDREIESRQEKVTAIRERRSDSVVREKLQQLGRLR